MGKGVISFFYCLSEGKNRIIEKRNQNAGEV
jgi:hypothetical protein